MPNVSRQVVQKYHNIPLNKEMGACRGTNGAMHRQTLPVNNDFRKAQLRLPSFGDYAINHPKVLELDMRKVKPSATIRYTDENQWCIVKGKNVRDYGFGQYRALSKKVLDSPYFCGKSFSWGDDYIQKCANGQGKTGNLMSWRRVGTNHHIEKVTRDIANFYAS